ncbi:MAG: hypothetical protein Q4F93_07295 [bacterium]|jgi:hypothetical protein|nr:hypothetical protein [bacterium]
MLDKFIAVLFIGTLALISPIVSKAWVELKATVSYDNNFNSTISATPQNGGNKTITSIQFIIVTRKRDSSPFDVSAYNYDYKIIETTITPLSSKKISIPYKIKQDYQFDGLLVEKVRYSDGSIKTY